MAAADRPREAPEAPVAEAVRSHVREDPFELGLVLGRRMQEVLVTESACFRGVAEGQRATAATGGVEVVEPAAG